MGEKGQGELGTLTLSSGVEVVVTRLPFGGLVAVKEALEGNDINAALKAAVAKADGEDKEQFHTSVGLNIAMALPGVAVAYLRWTVSTDGELPATKEFIDKLPVVDIANILPLCIQDITDVIAAVKNSVGPVRAALAGLQEQPGSKR